MSCTWSGTIRSGVENMPRELAADGCTNPRVPSSEVVRPAPIATVKVLKNVNLRKGGPNTVGAGRVLLANSEVRQSQASLSVSG